MTEYRMAYPKFKVFIFGVEVTSDVVSVNATYHDGDAPNSCSITLLNEHDKYIVTTQDLIKLNGLSGQNVTIPWLNGSSRGPVVASEAFGSAGVSADTDLSGIEPMKRAILEAKRRVTTPQIGAKDKTDPTGTPVSQTTTAFASYFGRNISRYPLADGAPVFHAMDQVRVFMRDPYDPKRWYHHFAGFISDMADMSDENNTKSMTIVVEDVTKLFRYTRVFINPGIIDAKAVIQEEDTKVQSFYSSFMRGLSLPEIVFTLIFGPDKANNEKFQQTVSSIDGGSSIKTSLRGIGHFDFSSSGIFTFGSSSNTETRDIKSTNKTSLYHIKPATHVKELSHWESVIDHEVHQSDLYSMMSESQKSPASGSALQDGISRAKIAADALPHGHDGLVDIEAVVDYIGHRPDVYPVDGGKLFMLIPEELGANNVSVVSNDIVNAYPLTSEWKSAGEILVKCIERIQFCIYASPKGDLIIEPPLFDFDPDDFGMTPITSSEMVALSSTKNFIERTDGTTKSQDVTYLSTLEIGEQNIPSNNRGPFGPAYVIRRGDTYSWESAIVDEKVHTIATTSANIVQNWESIGNMSVIGKLAVIKLPELIPLYGVRSLPVTAPGYIESQEGAFLYASIALNRQNADAHTIKLNMIPNIALRINRPVYIEGRNCIATIKQISHSLTWGAAGDMSTTIDLYATRTWNGQISTDNPPQPIYTPIGGDVSAALNYATLFSRRAKPAAIDDGNLFEEDVKNRISTGSAFDRKIIDNGDI